MSAVIEFDPQFFRHTKPHAPANARRKAPRGTLVALSATKVPLGASKAVGGDMKKRADTPWDVRPLSP
ncbi:hypothetical protein GCM10009675_27920 [Prauserella alba]|uniref:Uncharacterized protein n=1 Tax=Prauserella alba TaxID=176898 RepID=A0ABP4G756_9PSEU